MASNKDVKDFYEKIHKKQIKTEVGYKESDAPAYGQLESLKKYLALADIPIELGAGVGLLAHLHPKHTGLDQSFTALKASKSKRNVQCDAAALPIKNESVGMIFTNATMEHFSEPGKILPELDRVLKPGGILWFNDAWFCRPWRAGGIEFKPFKDCTFKEKLLKISIPIRENVAFRAAYVVPKRFFREIFQKITGKPTTFRFKKLKPNLERYDIADADAVASIDPHEVQIWFRSRDYIAPEKSKFMERMFIRKVVVLKKPD